MDFFGTISSLGAITTVIVFIGAALIFLKGSVYKGAIAALESTVSAQEKRIRILEDSDKKNKETIASLKEQNRLLLQQRPSADLISEISLALQEHDKKFIDFRDQVTHHFRSTP